MPAEKPMRVPGTRPAKDGFRPDPAVVNCAVKATKAPWTPFGDLEAE
jgi:hypothetical protein